MHLSRYLSGYIDIHIDWLFLQLDLSSIALLVITWVSGYKQSCPSATEEHQCSGVPRLSFSLPNTGFSFGICLSPHPPTPLLGTRRPYTQAASWPPFSLLELESCPVSEVDLFSFCSSSPLLPSCLVLTKLLFLSHPEENRVPFMGFTSKNAAYLVFYLSAEIPDRLVFQEQIFSSYGLHCTHYFQPWVALQFLYRKGRRLSKKVSWCLM